MENQLRYQAEALHKNEAETQIFKLKGEQLCKHIEELNLKMSSIQQQRDKIAEEMQ